jgi:hypothetical protein
MVYKGKRVARIIVKRVREGVEVRIMSPGSTSGQYPVGSVYRKDGDVRKAFGDLLAAETHTT